MVPGDPPRDPDPDQPTLFDAPVERQTDTASTAARPDPLAERLRQIDPDRMTPLEALQELARLKNGARSDP
jgi:hypothetical protein